MIQITIMDERDYILEFKDFNPKDRDGINIYVWQHMTSSKAQKIHIRKWPKES